MRAKYQDFFLLQQNWIFLTRHLVVFQPFCGDTLGILNQNIIFLNIMTWQQQRRDVRTFSSRLCGNKTEYLYQNVRTCLWQHTW